MLSQLIVIKTETGLSIELLTDLIPCFLVENIIWSVSFLNLPHNYVCKDFIKCGCPSRPQSFLLSLLVISFTIHL